MRICQIVACFLIVGWACESLGQDAGVLVIEPPEERRLGINVVLISGDEEYRSEEALPQLARILACRHGFSCVVLFAVDPESGEINPDFRGGIPGMERLADASLMIIATRFRDLPDAQMEQIDAYVRSGRPIIGLRTATHAFNLGEASSFRRFSWNYDGEELPEWEGGFGRHILGETWIAHHGKHGSQSTRGVVAPSAKDHPVARGLGEQVVWGPTDVYRVRLPLPDHSRPVVLGEVLSGMSPDDEPVDGAQNEPLMPIAWTREIPFGGGVQRVFTTTMGAATDFEAEGTRTMVINGVFWALGLGDQIPADGCASDVVGEYEPSDFGFGGFTPGVRTTDLESGCD